MTCELEKEKAFKADITKLEKFKMDCLFTTISNFYLISQNVAIGATGFHISM